MAVIRSSQLDCIKEQDVTCNNNSFEWAHVIEQLKLLKSTSICPKTTKAVSAQNDKEPARLQRGSERGAIVERAQRSCKQSWGCFQSRTAQLAQVPL